MSGTDEGALRRAIATIELCARMLGRHSETINARRGVGGTVRGVEASARDSDLLDAAAAFLVAVKEVAPGITRTKELVGLLFALADGFERHAGELKSATHAWRELPTQLEQYRCLGCQGRWQLLRCDRCRGTWCVDCRNGHAVPACAHASAEEP